VVLAVLGRRAFDLIVGRLLFKIGAGRDETATLPKCGKIGSFCRTGAKHFTHCLHKGGVYFAPRVQQWFDHSYRAFRALEPGEGFEPPPDLASLPS
jgi:hypothetical protein